MTAFEFFFVKDNLNVLFATCGKMRAGASPAGKVHLGNFWSNLISTASAVQLQFRNYSSVNYKHDIKTL